MFSAKNVHCRVIMPLLLLFIVIATSTYAEKLHSSRYSNDRVQLIPQSYISRSTQNDYFPSSKLIETPENRSRQLQKRSISIRLRDLQKYISQLIDNESAEMGNRRSMSTNLLFSDRVVERVQNFIERYFLEDTSSKALQSSGRVFLFKGFKKLIWPVFIGIQVAKTVLLAMFLPSIIGSIGKMVGKGLVSVSGFGQPQETVDDFEFKDNLPTDEQTNGMGYNYPQQQQMVTANQNSVNIPSYDSAPSANNQMSLYDLGQTYTNAFSMNNGQSMMGQKGSLQSKKDDFKVFHDIPASSMLLTNYDPFYSPLLSRLDSVFHQMNLNDDNEACREKLVCLMYASPAKYMPYSNLVSAQLSRELNELRKPTSDNPEILRFFKYMRSARDGQDGHDCQLIYKKCPSFTDTEQPAMLTTFNDINKLVQARHFKK